MASFSTYQHCQFSTIFTSGSSDIYIVGGASKGALSKRVLVLDCRSNHCRTLPNMLQPREYPAVDVINGKIYVTGGYESNNNEDWGKVYDPKTNTWEPILLPTTQDLTVQKSVEVPSEFKLVIDGAVYGMDGWNLNKDLLKNSCLVEINNVLCQMSLFNEKLLWLDQKGDHFCWNRVKGLEGLSLKNLISVANSAGGRRRVTVLRTSVVKFIRNRWIKECVCVTEIWCEEISFERSNLGELWGLVEWSKNVLTFDGYHSRDQIFLHSALITH